MCARMDLYIYICRARTSTLGLDLWWMRGDEDGFYGGRCKIDGFRCSSALLLLLLFFFVESV